MLAHAEIVVRAPDHNILRPLRRMPNSVWEAAGDPLQLGKHPVAAFVMQLPKRIGKICVVIHELPRLGGSSCFPFASVKNLPATSSEETIVPCPDAFRCFGDAMHDRLLILLEGAHFAL